MSLYVLLAVIFMITAFISATLIIVIIASKKSALYDDAIKQRDALKKLSDASLNIDNEIRDMTDDELLRRARGRW